MFSLIETISTKSTMMMKGGTESKVKLLAPKMRSTMPSGFRAERMAIGIAMTKAMIWLSTMISRSIGSAERIVPATEVCEMNEVPILPRTMLLIHVKYCR